MDGDVKRSELGVDFVSKLRQVLPDSDFGLHDPFLTETDFENVQKCLASGLVSTVSPAVTEFEGSLARVTGSAHIIATSSGTAALHLALMSVGVEPSNEVIVPAMTFVATANAVKYCGAEPHFVDVEENSLGIDPDKLRDHLRQIAKSVGGRCINRRTGKRIAALVPVHVFGLAPRMADLYAVSEEFGIPLVEDAAAALGSQIADRAAGTTGVVSAISFNGNKIVSTGGGGAAITDNEDLAREIRFRASVAREERNGRVVYESLGYNYRMPGINAALGLGQVQRLGQLVSLKRKVHAAYSVAFKSCDYLRVLQERTGTSSNYWLTSVVLTSGNSSSLETLLKAASSEGIAIRPAWNLLSKSKAYAHTPRSSLNVCESLEGRILSLPSGPRLCMEEL